MADSPIYVTRPALPPLVEFLPHLEQIWESHRLTNAGPMHEQLEQELAERFGVPHVVLCSNGTLALLLALRALGLKGQVITTPYSFVATAHAIVWAGLDPVFVDIDPDTYNLAPTAIEQALVDDTCCILPVHCYGNPCDVDAIAALATAHRLPVLYDAAHAFDVQCHCGSLLQHGDLAVLSFHATKIFSTLEGGAIICHDDAMRKKLEYLRNFGFENETTVAEIGINAKMNEVQAALGRVALDHVGGWIAERAAIEARYRRRLAGIPGISCLPEPGPAVANHAYFPIQVDARHPWSRDELYAHLAAHEIHARRYFYPLITDFPMYANARIGPGGLEHARRAADQVICLPIYPGLAESDQQRICDLIASPPGHG